MLGMVEAECHLNLASNIMDEALSKVSSSRVKVLGIKS